MKSKNVLLVLLLITVYHRTKSTDTRSSKSSSENEDILQIESGWPTKTTRKLCNADEIFNKVVEDEVKKCVNLTKLFQFGSRISPEEYKAGTFYLAIAFAVDAGASKDSLHDAVLVTRNMPPNSKKLVSDVVVAAYVGSVSKFLDQRKILNCTNARKLAKTFAQQMKDTYLAVSDDGYPRSTVTVLAVVPGKFLSALTPLDSNAAATFAGLIGEAWKHQEDIGAIPDADKKIPPIKRATSNPLLKARRKACLRSKTVQKFFKAYLDYLKPSETLSDLVTLKAPVDYFRGSFYMGQYLMQAVDVADSAVLADFMSMYVKDDWGLEPSTVTFVHGNFIAKFLESQQILDPANATTLGRLYAKTLEEAAKTIAHSDNSRSKIVALGYGIKNFLIKLNIFNTERAKPFAFFFGNEWFCQRFHHSHPTNSLNSIYKET